jgi:hypothetical protein
VPFLIWALAVATIIVAVWLVRHPVALLTVNVEVATWMTFGPTAALVLGAFLWASWCVRILH